MEEQLAPKGLFWRLVETTGFVDLVGGASALAAGIEHIAAELRSVGSEALAADARGTDLAEAVDDFENYPHLARFHAGVSDILTRSLPPELVKWARRLLAMPELPLAQEVHAALVASAIQEADAVRRVLFKVILFEGIRLNLAIQARHGRGAFTAIGGTGHHLSVIAETEMRVWLEMQPHLPSDVRPFRLMVEAALRALQTHQADLKETVAELATDVVEIMHLRAQLDDKLTHVEAGDAVLLRNAFAPALREEGRLTIETLQARHPLVLGEVNRNTLDQRVLRLKEHMKTHDGDLPRRKGTALVDLLDEALGTPSSKEDK